MFHEELNKLINIFANYKEDVFLSYMHKIIDDKENINKSLKIFNQIFKNKDVSLHLKFLLIKKMKKI